MGAVDHYSNNGDRLSSEEAPALFAAASLLTLKNLSEKMDKLIEAVSKSNEAKFIGPG